MTITHLVAVAPYIALHVLTFCAFAAAGAWRDRHRKAGGLGGRSPLLGVAAFLVIGAIMVAAALLFLPRETLPPGAEAPTASYRSMNALRQLAINAAMVAPFVGWVMWRRQGLAALGIGKDDALRSLAIGACVSLACIPILGRLSMPFWSTPGTWWMLLAMLGVGASEEVISRGFVLGVLVKRLPRLWAELGSAALFAIFHVPQRIGSGMSPEGMAVSLLTLVIFGWCYAAAMRSGRNVPGLALVHAIGNVCAIS